MAKCTYDPTPLVGIPMGMFHCPECGEMILAGLPHIEWERLDEFLEKDNMTHKFLDDEDDTILEIELDNFNPDAPDWVITVEMDYAYSDARVQSLFVFKDVQQMEDFHSKFGQLLEEAKKMRGVT